MSRYDSRAGGAGVMTDFAKPCPYCKRPIRDKKDFIFEEHQGKFSARCAGCMAWRGEWRASYEESIEHWNNQKR